MVFAPIPLQNLFNILSRLTESFLLTISFKNAVISLISSLLKNLYWSTRANSYLEELFFKYSLNSIFTKLLLVNIHIFFLELSLL